MIFIDNTDQPLLENLSRDSEVNAFNTSFPPTMPISSLNIPSWNDITNSDLPNENSHAYIQDFVQLSNGSYLILISNKDSGIYTDGNVFHGGGNTIIMLDSYGELEFIKTFHHYSGNSQSNLVKLTEPCYGRVGGLTTMMILNSNEIVVGGMLGDCTDNHMSFDGVINSSNGILTPVIAKINLNTWNITQHIVLSLQTSSPSTGNFCVLNFLPSGYNMIDSQKITFQLSHSGITSHVCSLTIGNKTIPFGGNNRFQEAFITLDHNLSVLNSHKTSDHNGERLPLAIMPNGDLIMVEKYPSNNRRIISHFDQNYSLLNSNITTGTYCNGNIYHLSKLSNQSVYFICTSLSQTGTSHQTTIITYNISTQSLKYIELGVGNRATDNVRSGSIPLNETHLLITVNPDNLNSFTTTDGKTMSGRSTFVFDISSNTSYTTNTGHINFRHGGSYQSLGKGSTFDSGTKLTTQYFVGESLMILTNELTSMSHLKIFDIDNDLDMSPDKFDSFPYDRTQQEDYDGDGYGDNPKGSNPDECPFQAGNSTIDYNGCLDTDGDGYSDQTDLFDNDETQVFDKDGDGYGDNQSGRFGDNCPLEFGESNRDSYGCPDADYDGWSNNFDVFDNESSQWSDRDDDGYGDELNGFQGDACPKNAGNSTLDRFGCRDTDNDGWSDIGDALPMNPTQWIDRDGDGFGENNSEKATEIDLFPSDGTQWNDTDGDGHGDNPYGTQGDWFPDDPTRWMDSDRDSTADEDDAFPNDATQQIDSDGDGYGDNVDGNRGDVFPDDPLEWKDSDGDNLGDNTDIFPYDPTQTEDRDGDGMGDNPMGIGADRFPDDPTQWGDIDGDGYGDNQTGTNPDKFITDATQWADRDGDGYGDNPQGRLYDLFPDNPTQWEDTDEDGLGDNQSGTDADPFLNDFDNDGYNDSIDILPKLSSPGDLDADGCLDEVDAFPENALECVDTDGDGIGNQADSDDDGDGWTDADEDRLGTDSLSSSDTPVDSFEIVIPGTAVGLGAWDLIGMFGGIPLFIWIGFGFATRNGRCTKYEDLLNSANSRDELEQVALRWEYSLMLRMLGPHQGIRLERLRAELDDKFENATYDETEIGYDQTNLVENAEKEIPPITESFTVPTKETTATSTDESGYEWFKQGEENWYRNKGSEDEWLKFEN